MSELPPTSLTFSVFAHLHVDKTPLYRAILALFVTARARFVIALRPSEIQAALASVFSPTDSGPRADAQISNLKSQLDSEAVSSALQQLRVWGNLGDTPDNADAATIEEFYQRRVFIN